MGEGGKAFQGAEVAHARGEKHQSLRCLKETQGWFCEKK